MKGIKIAKRIIISLMILLSASICVLISIKNNVKEKQTQAISYTFGTNDETQLAAATEYYIDSAEGYKEFASSLWYLHTTPGYGGVNSVTNVAKKTSYKGKVVYLKKDINVINTGEDRRNGLFNRTLFTFDGTFDGQGNTISFRNITDTLDCCFCMNLTGTIKNLKISDIEYFSENILLRTYDGNWGMLVRKNEGTIENCIVQNAKFISRNYKSDLNVAPLVGNNAGTVKNCIVTGKYEIGGHSWNLMSNSDGCYAYYFVASGTAATNCIFDATVTKVGDYTEHCIAPSEHDSIGSNFSSYASAYESMETDISTTSGEEGTAWFKYKSGCGYNKDATISVYLRSFIDWATIVFEAQTGGTVSVKTIDVPDDYISATENGASLTIYDKTITATVTHALYGFAPDIWTGSGYSYTANFVQKYVYASFASCSVAGNTPSTYEYVIVDIVADGANVQFTYNKLTGVLNAYCYKDNVCVLVVDYGFISKKYIYKTVEVNKYGTIMYYKPKAEVKEYKVTFG